MLEWRREHPVWGYIRSFTVSSSLGLPTLRSSARSCPASCPILPALPPGHARFFPPSRPVLPVRPPVPHSHSRAHSLQIPHVKQQYTAITYVKHTTVIIIVSNTHVLLSVYVLPTANRIKEAKFSDIIRELNVA